MRSGYFVSSTSIARSLSEPLTLLISPSWPSEPFHAPQPPTVGSRSSHALAVAVVDAREHDHHRVAVARAGRLVGQHVGQRLHDEVDQQAERR